MTAISDLILKDRKIAYVVSDEQLKVVAAGGADELFKSANVWPILGRSLLEISPELIGAEESLTDILAGRLPSFELMWVNRNGPKDEPRYFELTTMPHQNYSGQIDGLIHIWQDVTQLGEINQQFAQHRNEMWLLQRELDSKNEALAASNAELQQLANLKSMFVSFAAHELGSPLTSMIGYIDLLLEGAYGPLSDSQTQSLKVVARSIGRLRAITNNLLVATRIETGHLEAVLQVTNLLDLIEDVVAEYQPQVAAKSQQLVVEIPEKELPPVLCDTTLAAQIVGNLVSNASKYTRREGRITVGVGVRPGEEGFLEVSVADTGIGIPPAEYDQLFKRFSRLSTANQVNAAGTGLGLYITQSLVELHGGRIWFESDEQQGSTFFVTFPIAENDN
ncbi:MAG: PAS domain-containing sensor histidine kinase [Chloroflexi bacterium]|nr:MAG: PAS domain-containing sensor histidine kinase [Chloroflexota bacterium]